MLKCLTPDIATIDSTGEFEPVREGMAHRGVDGRRLAERVPQLRCPCVSRAGSWYRSRWSEPLAQRWVPFGDPRPLIVDDPILGHAFLNNGDGYYFSGAYLPLALDATHGMVLETTVRLPVTRPQGQLLQIMLQGIRDAGRLRREWDHVTGYIPAQFIDNARGCNVRYPEREGKTGALSMSVIGAPASGPPSPTSATGPTDCRCCR